MPMIASGMKTGSAKGLCNRQGTQRCTSGRIGTDGNSVMTSRRKRRKTMVQIDMQKPDHCLRCPLLNNDDMCCLQDYEGQEEKWDWTWEQQMQNCPLKEVDSLNPMEEES
jgi:hypothetical protein